MGGELSPGSRLPTRTEIEAIYGAGPIYGGTCVSAICKNNDPGTTLAAIPNVATTLLMYENADNQS